MRLGARLLRDKRVGGFLKSVMNEPVGTIETIDELLAPGFPQSRVHLFFGCSHNYRKRRDVGDVAEASELLQRLPRVERQPRQLPGQELNDVVRVPFGVDAAEVPGPSYPVVIE